MPTNATTPDVDALASRLADFPILTGNTRGNLIIYRDTKPGAYVPEKNGIVPQIVDLELPRLNSRDVEKLVNLPEPRRTAMWIKMTFVACNDHLVDLHILWEAYKEFFEPLVGSDPSHGLSVATERYSLETYRPRGSTAQAEQAAPLKQESQVEQKLEVEAGDKHQRAAKPASVQDGGQDGHLEPPSSSKARPQRTVAPLLQSFTFYRVFTSRVHGLTAYSTNGAESNADWRMIFRGVRARQTALTFPSTNREHSLRQLQRYKDKNAIIQPANMSRFSQLLAQDPLFILPKETKSPMYQRMVADHGQFGGVVDYDGKGEEDPAFPGFCLRRRDIFIGGRPGRRSRRSAPANEQTTMPDDSQTGSGSAHNLTKEASVNSKGEGKMKADDTREPTSPNFRETHTEATAARTALKKYSLKPSPRIDKAVADSQGKVLAALDQLACDMGASSSEQVDSKTLANILIQKCAELHPENKDVYSTRTKQMVQSVLDAYPEAFDINRLKKSNDGDPKAGHRRRSTGKKTSKGNAESTVESAVASEERSTSRTFMELATTDTKKGDSK